MRKILVTLALFAATLVGGSGSGLRQNHADALGCSIDGEQGYDGVWYTQGWAWFECYTGPYKWIRVMIRCDGSAAWTYGGWKGTTSASGSSAKSIATCWPGTHVNAVTYQLSY